MNQKINVFIPFLILHTGEKHNALSHIKIWYQYFDESEIDFIIVTRFEEAYVAITKEYPHANIVYAKNKKDIDQVFDSLASIKACFYPSNTGSNAHLLYQTDIKHIFIGHGDSDKSASAHKFFRAYDENWVAGQAHIDRFKNAGFHQNGLTHIKVGRPSLSKILKIAKSCWRDRCDGKYNILYLPTWEGTYKEQDYSSLSIIKNNLISLNEKKELNIQVKLHPFTGQRENEFSSIENELGDELDVKVISKTETLGEYIEKSNLFICDISAVVSECLAANAPIFLYIPKNKEIKISQSDMPYEKYCYVYSNPDELMQSISEVITGNDYLADNRLEAMTYIINPEDTLNKTFVKKLKNLGV